MELGATDMWINKWIDFVVTVESLEFSKKTHLEKYIIANYTVGNKNNETIIVFMF